MPERAPFRFEKMWMWEDGGVWLLNVKEPFPLSFLRNYSF